MPPLPDEPDDERPGARAPNGGGASQVAERDGAASQDAFGASSPSTFDTVQALCSTYLADCSAGEPRSLGVYVQRLPADAQPVLVRNLLHLELERRRAVGAPLDAEELIREIPGFEALLREVLLEAADQSLSSVGTATGPGAERPLPPGTDPFATRASSLHALPGASFLGNYRLIRELGRGGMGAVFEAEHLRSHERVALKILPVVDARRLHRFKREFRSMAEINHPNLIGLHSLEQDGGQWYFTMDLIDGENFLSWVRPNGQLSVSRLQEAFSQLVGGILALHGRHIIHRDLKPSNVMVTGRGRVIVLDFGLVFEEQHSDLSQREFGAGTPAYMAPEQASSGVLSGAVDWYAAGVMLYEALCGRRPFAGGSAMELIRRKCEEAPPPVVTGSEVPAELCELAMRLLSRDAGQRPDALEIARYASGMAPQTSVTAGGGTLLIGRDQQLAELESAYDGVRREQLPGVVFVRGRSGEGKTSLVEHFVEQLKRRDARPVVLSGRCYDRESVPFKALDSLVDALTAHLRGLSETDAALLMPDDVDLLAHLFPVLQRVGCVERLMGQRALQLDPQQVRKRSFLALRALLNRITRRVPVLLVADDLQWGDADSAEVLMDVLRTAEGPSALFIGCFRSDEADDSPFLRKWSELQAGESGAGVRDVSVSALSVDECTRLTIALVGRDDESIRRRAMEFHEQTGGNPFLLIELIGCFDPASDSFRAMPIQEVIVNKLGRLPAEAAPLLHAICVAGRSIRLEEASRTVQQAASMALVTHMRSEKLVRLLGGDEDPIVDTYHDKIRESVLDDLDEDRRRMLHRQLGEVIESTAGGLSAAGIERVVSGEQPGGLRTNDRLFDLAYHFDAAGSARKACAYAVLAGEQASRQFSQQAAAEQFGIAQRNSGSAPEGFQFRIRRGYGRALALLGRYEDAASVVEGLEDLAPEPFDKAQVLGLQAEIAHKRGRIGGGMALYAAALGTLGYWSPRTRLTALFGLAYETLVQAGHTLLPRQLYRRDAPPDRELELAVELANRNSIVSYYNNSVQMLWTHLKGLNLSETRQAAHGLTYAYGLHPAPAAAVGMCARGLRYSDIAIQLTEETNDLLTRGHCFAMRSMAQYTSGLYAAAVESAGTAIELLTQAGDPYVVFIAETHKSFAHWRLLRTREAIECAYGGFTRAVRLGEDASAGGQLLALAFATNGDFPFPEMRSCCRVGEGDHMSVSFLRTAEGIWHLRAGRTAEAVSVFREAWQVASRNLVVVPYTVTAGPWLAGALRQEAQAGKAAGRRAKLLREAGKVVRVSLWLTRLYVSERAHAVREQGLLLAERGKTEAALKVLRRSSAIAERQGDRWQHAVSAVEVARVEAALGMPEGARHVSEREEVLQRVEVEIRESLAGRMQGR